MIDREDDVLAQEVGAAEGAVDRDAAVLVGFDRDIVNDAPLRDRADRQRAGGSGDGVLLGLVNLAFGVLQAGTRGGLDAEANPSGDARVTCDAMRDRGTRGTGTGGGALGQDRSAAAQQRE